MYRVQLQKEFNIGGDFSWLLFAFEINHSSYLVVHFNLHRVCTRINGIISIWSHATTGGSQILLHDDKYDDMHLPWAHPTRAIVEDK